MGMNDVSNTPVAPVPLVRPAGDTFAVEGKPLAGRKVLIIVENLPLPFDRRVWHEAKTLTAAGATVSVICPTGKGYEKRYEVIEGVHIHRHPLSEASGKLAYFSEYLSALFWETLLAWKIKLTRGFDVIQGCNPPDLIFLVAWQFRPLGVRYIFDHHDINPELFEAKFNKTSGLFFRGLKLVERLTFRTAKVSIATNQSYRRIAIERGGMDPADVFVVRSGPDLRRLVPVPPVEKWKNGRRFLVGYVGVMGDQEGIDLLIDAIEKIVKREGRQDIQFVLVGGGPSLRPLQDLAASRGLADYVTFTGRAPDQDLMEVLSTSDVCVNPDRVNAMNDKSTMNKIMEYMAFAKPIVQFDVTEGRFSAQEASLYAKANDTDDLAAKIRQLIDDPDQRARMGASGQQRVHAELGWEKQIAPLIAAYLRALG
jgi:glycosyltransferase involved in cell wall biosynthesis